MPHLNQTYELLTGGDYSGDSSWNKTRTEIDNCFKLYHMTEGEVFIADKHQTYRLTRDNLYFINGNRLQRQYCNQSFSTIWLHFIPKDLSVYRGLLSMPTVVWLPIGHYNLRHTLPVLERLLKPSSSTNNTFIVDTLIVQTLLQTVTIQLFEQHPSHMSKTSADGDRIEAAIKHIHENYRSQPHLKELAELCYMSPNYFHKIFKNTMQTTPANYIALLKMNAALQLHGDGRRAIKDIAYELGFTDVAHFCRSFRKYYGIPPGEYRKLKGKIII